MSTSELGGSGPRFTILPPQSTDDDASPSDSCFKDVQRIFNLIADERHLCAHALYTSVVQRIKEHRHNSKNGAHHHKQQQSHHHGIHTPRIFRRSQSTKDRLEKDKDTEDAQKLLEANKAALERLKVSFCKGGGQELNEAFSTIC